MALTLHERIQQLPQEIQDLILDFTLTTSPSGDNTVLISESYRAPIALQINREIRQKVAKSYYRTTTFISELDTYYNHISTHSSLARWSKSLSDEHRQLVGRVRCVASHRYSVVKVQPARVARELLAQLELLKIGGEGCEREVKLFHGAKAQTSQGLWAFVDDISEFPSRIDGERGW